MTFTFIPTEIDKLLRSGGTTLETVIEESDVVQECRGGNTLLIEFLKSEGNLEKLKCLTISEPPETDNSYNFKYASIASDLLSAPVRCLAEKVTAVLVAPLYSHLEAGPLHPLTMSFILKIFLNSATFCPSEFTQLVTARGNFISLLVQNIEIFAVAGFISDVYASTCRLVQYFDAHSLPLRLVLCFSDRDSRAFVVCRLLCDLICGPVDIFPAEKAEMIIAQLCQMLSCSAPDQVLKVFCTIFDPVGSEYCDRKYDYGKFLGVMTPHVHKFSLLLRDVSGSTRLHVVKLLASALKYDHEGFVRELMAHRVVADVVDLCFSLPYQSLLHCQVLSLLQRMVCLALTFPPMEDLAIEIFKNFELVDKCIDVFERETEQFNYSVRKTDYTAQSMSILMILKDIGGSEGSHSFFERLGLERGPKWTDFAAKLERYRQDNKSNFGQPLLEESEDDGEDEEFVMDDEFDTEAHSEFMRLRENPLRAIEINVPVTFESKSVGGLEVRDPFEEIDRSIGLFDPSRFHDLTESNASHRKFMETYSKGAEVCGRGVPRVSFEEVEEIQGRKVEGIRWNDEEGEAEDRDRLFEWPSLADVWGCFGEETDLRNPFEEDVTVD